MSAAPGTAYTYRVFADTSGQFRPFDGPYGIGMSPSPSGVVGGTPLPPFVSSNLVTLANGPISTNDPWLPAGATETRGNNVDAYADLVPADGFTPGGTDVRADVTAPGVFDRTYDFNQRANANTTQIKAAVTHLFFLTNWFHDWYYDVGFDEKSGNAQESNLGRTVARSRRRRAARRGPRFLGAQQRQHVHPDRRRLAPDADVLCSTGSPTTTSRSTARPPSPATTSWASPRSVRSSSTSPGTWCW